MLTEKIGGEMGKIQIGKFGICLKNGIITVNKPSKDYI